MPSLIQSLTLLFLVQGLASADKCGCSECTSEVLNTMAGAHTCGDRIAWLQSDMGLSETDACRKVAGNEFSSVCGPWCDPNKCDLPPTPVTPYPTYTAAAPSPLYCFPPEEERVTYENVWSKYQVQVKEAGFPCGPGNNIFSKDSVSRSANDIILKYQNRDGKWTGSEVRVTLPTNEKYAYGTYKFHVKNINVLNRNRASISNTLPKDLVLGLFTWDDTERYDVHENWNHEVDVEISKWGEETNSDVQFLMQPPGNPQMYRFFSGQNGNTYNQGNHWYNFEWLPGKITWTSTAGGGHTHVYTTQAAVQSRRRDYIQCLPAEMEIRLNLWNMYGANAPDGLADDMSVEVVIDEFQYEPSSITHIEQGGICSKHCQCQGFCINGKCESVGPTPPTNPTPAPPSPTSPTPNGKNCGCQQCTDEVFNSMAGDYSCKARIEWLQSTKGYSEYDACKTVGGDEFPSVCGKCDPRSCNSLPNPTPSPTSNPTQSPTADPSKSPSAVPSPSTSSPCGCRTCTERALSTLAGGHTCGARINWVQSSLGFTESNACKLVAGKEFPTQCGLCDPDKCKIPAPTPTPPTTSLKHCGCQQCTDEVFNSMAGGFTCKARIEWLQSAKGYSEYDACKTVGGDEFPTICGKCDPRSC